MLTDMRLHKFDVYQGKVVLRVVLRATETLDIMIFFKKKCFCLMSGLTFTLSDATSFLPDNLSEL